MDHPGLEYLARPGIALRLDKLGPKSNQGLHDLSGMRSVLNGLSVYTS
jgi:hypothetical protein